MPLEIATRKVRHVTVVDLKGRITIGDGSKRLRHTVRDLLEQGAKSILLNLAETDFVDSAGLGELVGSFVTASRAGGAVKLLNVQKRIRDVFTITKIHTVFEVYENQNLAVLSFEPRLDS